jgi:hypothetical protein
MTSDQDLLSDERRAQTARYINRMAELGRAQLQAERTEKQGLKPTDRQSEPSRMTHGK